MPCDYEYILAKLRKVTSPMRACMLSRFIHVQLFVTLWTEACHSPLSMGFSRQECWSGVPGPPPGDLSDSRIEPTSHYVSCTAGGFFTTSASWEALLKDTDCFLVEAC